VPTVEVNGGRLWYDEAGSGPALVLVHGGLGDSGLWEPVVPFLAERFRVIRTDFRFFGRSTGPAAPWSWHDDIVGLLDELGIDRAALVGLSLGGRLAIEIALGHPERISALALVAPGLAGHAAAPYSEEQGARYDAAEAEGDFDAMLAVDLEVWAPLGADETIARLWFATPDANPLPAGVEPRAPAGPPAKERLGELSVPTLVITASHDPKSFREIGPLIATAAPNARHVELDSDHYVTLREPELLARALLDFLATSTPEQ
jgi:pimeloyl-ACP methyl ester carboxylesterase